MENVKIEEKIKTSDDGKGILITNDAIEQISSLLKNQTDKKAFRPLKGAPKANLKSKDFKSPPLFTNK